MKNAQSARFDNAHTNSSADDPKDRDSSASAEQNPILNALFSTDPVIEGFETLEEWTAHRDTVVQGLNPVGKLETLHAERAAMYLWRLDRVIRFEKIATQFDHNEVFAEFIVALDNKEIPRDRSEAATVEKIRKPLNDYLNEYQKIGARAAKLPELKEGLDTVRDAAKRVRERRLLPDQPTVQTIIKYESHLDRCLARTMTELRRLQKERRQGLRPVDEFGENPSARAIFREGEPRCEPVLNHDHSETPARSAPRTPGIDIPAPAILREGEPPCEPVLNHDHSKTPARTAPRPPGENAFTETPARSAPRPPGIDIPAPAILREDEPPCEPVIFHDNKQTPARPTVRPPLERIANALYLTEPKAAVRSDPFSLESHIHQRE